MISLITAIDISVLQLLYDARSLPLVQALIFISELGTTLDVFGLGVCVALVLLARRHYAYAAGLAITLGTSGISILLIKGLVERARPDVFYRAYPEIWYSFPSAHATLITALYVLLIYISWKLIPHRPARILLTTILSACIILVSFSRIYLGVHYLSDVLAGILLGAVCAWLGYRWILFAKQS